MGWSIPPTTKKTHQCLPALSETISLLAGTVMANKGPSYGLSREVQSKIDKKYDQDLEERLTEWIIAQCDAGVGQPEAGKTGWQNWLKDGCVSACPHVCVNGRQILRHTQSTL